MMSTRLLTAALLASSALLLTACGPAAHNQSTSSTDIAKKRLPEPHGGTMTFEPQTKDPVLTAEPTPEPNKTDKEEPVVIDPQHVSLGEHHPICQDAYDKDHVTPKDLVCPRCLHGDFMQPEPKRTKLDILFVADSSPSLETERTAIAKGVRQFIAALPAGTDYRLAVMPAHSDVSYDEANKHSTGLAGHLLVAGNEPAVLKKSDYKKWSDISDLLTRKLSRIKLDAASDGGELGLFSLDKGISEPQLSANRQLGFFRDDAALAVIFISDENDICSYGVNYPAGVEPKKNVNQYLKTGLTVEEKANQFYCRDANGNPTITARSVFTKLREMKQIANTESNEAMPLLVSGILYTSEESVPTTPAPDEKFPEYFGENEMGHGYLDIINDNQGVAVDISKGDFDAGLKLIGEAAALKLEVKSEFQLKEGTTIDPDTLCVVVDGQEVPAVPDFGTRVDGLSYVFKGDLRELQLRGIGARNKDGHPSKVDVFYCEPPDVIRYNPEQYSRFEIPTRAEHYRNLPVPKACKSVRDRITSGALDGPPVQ